MVVQPHLPHGADPDAALRRLLDERLDLGLLAAVAGLRHGVQFVLIGPTAKIDPDDLPARPNLHYLGSMAGTPQGFAGGIDQALALQPASWRPAADDLLAGMS